MATLRSLVVCVALMTLMVVSSVEAAASRSRGPYIKKKPTVVEPAVPAIEPQGNSQPLSPLTGAVQVKGSQDDEALRHIEELENTVTTMKQDKVQLEQSLHSLRLITINLQNELQIVANKVVELDRISTNNRELTRLLTYFETFFGVLYREESETFNPSVPVETRLSRLNIYIGNRDAEMAGIRPEPPVETLPDTNGVSVELTNAVTQLGEENSRLAAKVTTLEQDVATTTAEVKSAKSKSGSGGFGGACACNNEDMDMMDERLSLVERSTAILISPVLNGANDGSATSRKAGTTIDLLTDDDMENIRALQFDSRGVSDSRKSVFSAIRHTHMLGDDIRQTLTFDNVHVNKGNHFTNNSILVCGTEGFYFFQYTVRSYDGHYMGVALVKNGEMMTSVYTDASERSIMQSQSIILHLTKGDMVSLELGSSERFAVHSDVHKYITFNGFLVYKGR